MKESSYHNPKMAVYCKEVRKLEDKFDSLKLNHIPRQLNEADDELAKMASGQELVLIGVFTVISISPRPATKRQGRLVTSHPPRAQGLGNHWFLLTPLAQASGLAPHNPHLTPRSWRSTKIQWGSLTRTQR
jgi:hypothetical protein